MKTRKPRQPKPHLHRSLHSSQSYNRRLEEDQMWTSHARDRRDRDRNRRPSPAGARMRMDQPHRERRPRRAPEGSGRPELGSVMRRARRDGQQSMYWTKKLLDFEERDPARWGHSGFRELYMDQPGGGGDRDAGGGGSRDRQRGGTVRRSHSGPGRQEPPRRQHPSGRPASRHHQQQRPRSPGRPGVPHRRARSPSSSSASTYSESSSSRSRSRSPRSRSPRDSRDRRGRDRAGTGGDSGRTRSGRRSRSSSSWSSGSSTSVTSRSVSPAAGHSANGKPAPHPPSQPPRPPRPQERAARPPRPDPMRPRHNGRPSGAGAVTATVRERDATITRKVSNAAVVPPPASERRRPRSPPLRTARRPRPMVAPPAAATGTAAVAATRRRPASESAESSSSSGPEEPARTSLSERFGRLAQLSVQRGDAELVRLKIVKDTNSSDKKVILEEEPGVRAGSAGRQRSQERVSFETEYREYFGQKLRRAAVSDDPVADLPRQLPRDWETDVSVRYRYYRDAGYFRDHMLTLEEYIKWEQWWYRYREWLRQQQQQRRPAPPALQLQAPPAVARRMRAVPEMWRERRRRY